MEESNIFYAVSAGYNGEQKKVFLRFYNPATGEVRDWLDNTNHKPYCFTDVDDLAELSIFEGVTDVTRVTKYNALIDKHEVVTRVETEDPLKIGGENKDAMRNRIPTELGGKVWETYVKYYECYIYDRDIKMGMPYTFDDKGDILPFVDLEAEERIKKILEAFKGDTTERLKYIENWARFFEYSAPYSKRISLDIEVYNEKKRIADPEVADKPVLSIAMWDDKGRKILLVLIQPNKQLDLSEVQSDTDIEFFNDETDLHLRCFEIIKEYPFLITFNGDAFDLPYLRQRALNLGIPKEQIPLSKHKNEMHTDAGVHIDLYRFFFITAIQVYAFKQKYSNDDLDTIGRSLIGLSKIKMTPEREKQMEDEGTIILTYNELLNYNLRDAEITLKLTTFDNGIVMNLIWALTRIAHMAMEETSRHAVGHWIKSVMFYEHRRWNYLIPNAEDIKALKGATLTIAKIKGKKYKGAIVVDPVTGIHFFVVVMDFQSLYPSICKQYNLGYQTVRCPHKECKDNIPFGAPHWVCKKHRAMESIFIGAFKDLRVQIYKSKPKDKSLREGQKAWYSTVEQTIKVFCNAAYGVFGADSFPLYCPPVAEMTTAIGRIAVTETIKKAQSLGLEVLYGDTDSIFIKNPPEEKLKELIKWAGETLELDLAPDKKYRYCVLSNRKKNYFGVFEDGEVDVKGLTGKKKHTPPIIRSAFDDAKKILSKIQTEEDFNVAKQQLATLVRTTYYIIKRRQWKSLEDLSFSMNLSMELDDYTKSTPQHVSAAKQLKEKGYDVAGGDTIKFVKVVGGKKKSRAKPIQLAKDSEIDVEKYIESLRNMFAQILDAIDMDFNFILGLQRIDRWF